MHIVKMEPSSEASRTGPGLRFLGRLDQAGPLSFEASARAFGSRPIPRVPGYGREPVGNGHAAAGFSAGRAPELSVDDAVAGLDVIVAAGLASEVAA